MQRSYIDLYVHTGMYILLSTKDYLFVGRDNSPGVEAVRSIRCKANKKVHIFNVMQFLSDVRWKGCMLQSGDMDSAYNENKFHQHVLRVQRNELHISEL